MRWSPSGEEIEATKQKVSAKSRVCRTVKAVMNDYIVNGYAVWLSKEEGDSRNGHTWYLPHHGVINPDDGLISVLTTEKAVEVSLKLIKLVQGGEFCLTTFVSNAKEVLSAIPAEERTVKNLDLNKLPI